MDLDNFYLKNNEKSLDPNRTIVNSINSLINELSNYLAKGDNGNKYNSYWNYQNFIEDNVSAKVGISRWGNDITYYDDLGKAVDDTILELANKEGTLYRKQFMWNSSNNGGFYNVDKYEKGQITHITVPKSIIPSELENKDLIFQYTNKGNIKIRDDIKEKTISLASQKAEKLRDKEQERNAEFKKEGHIYEAFEDDGYIFLNDLTEERDFSIEDIDFVVDNYEGDGKYQVINGEYKKVK